MRVQIARPLAIVGVVGLASLFPTAAIAQSDESGSGDSFQARLAPLNNQQGSGHAMLQFEGDQATVTVNYSGLAETFQGGPFPHAQHIHIAAQGTCPDQSLDSDGDGVISTPEGQPAYGAIGTSLTTSGDTSPDSALAVERFPGGPSAEYERTFTLDPASTESVRSGTGVIVVHGVDPSLISEQAANAKSPLDESLPLAATAPALCGTLNPGQMDGMPSGGADTGGGPGGTDQAVLYSLGGAALIGALGAGVAANRRRNSELRG